jgi:asparagine synthase (glutamine-hydrolysing)
MGQHGTFYVASELKALEGCALKFNYFLRALYDSKMVNLFNGTRDWTEYDTVKDSKTNIQDIKVALEAAVHR